MKFDWDKANEAHIAAHRVTLSDVEQVYANDPLDLEFRVVEGEERYTILGHTDQCRVLVVAFDASRNLRIAYLKSKGYEDA